MDVFNIGAGQAPKAPESGQVERHSQATRGDKTQKAEHPATDSFAASSSVRRVDSLVDRLIAGPDGEIRADLVDQFRALMEVGELDTPENAGEAADGILSGPESV